MTWLLIPAKHSTLAKSRLTPVLGAEARAVLARLLLARLLSIAAQSAEVAEVLVISEDVGLQTIARLFGYPTISDPAPDLNLSLEAGRDYALARGCTSLLVLPTDLPWLTSQALVALLRQSRGSEPQITIARDRQGSGTNALFQRPAGAIPFSFGPGSAQCHSALARRAGIPLMEVMDPALSFDLDSPEDWARLVA
ncbi:MAG: 2-phospho-L-lactate guanylyltransferase [Ardenticatenales bacterium]|nr:2-phospho-L-lactate guanylyltransferase [Ardenticatenales bacterium]